MAGHVRSAAAALLAVVLVAGTAGCSDGGRGGDGRAPDRTGQPRPTEGGSEPAAPQWRPVESDGDATITVGGRWTVLQHPDRVVLQGPDPVTVRAPEHHRISHALLDASDDGGYVVVVAEDERAERPDTATVVDLASGERTVLDGESEVPTTTGGTWALGQGRLLHATRVDGAYCLAEVDLGNGRGAVRWCAPERHGFADARVTPAGTTLLTFDDDRPSCRTVVRVTDDGVEPITQAAECTAWDGLLLQGATLWSVVPEASRVEQATFHADADAGAGTVDLGPGTSGSLTWCSDAAYFVRDPQRSADPARLVRWSPTAGAEVVYETAAEGRAFLGEPRCGGDHLTVSAFTDQGDEQVTTALR